METILVCDGTLEGILTAVYKAYEWKLPSTSTRIQLGADDLQLFAGYREVETDSTLAQKVISTIQRRFGEEAWENISYALAAEAPDRGQAVYRTIAAGLSGQVRGPLMGGLANDDIRRVFELSRRVHHEEHRMVEFLRFREVEGKILYAPIEPGADVTALIMPHFADRFPLENFIIADLLRGIMGVHVPGKDWVLVRMNRELQEYLTKLGSLKTEQEQEMAELFRHFCDSVAIRERRNPKLQRQLLPLKYRFLMTEFEEQL